MAALIHALLLAALSLPSGYALDHPRGQVNVQGRLFCSPTGMPDLGFDTPGVGGVNVGIVCEPVMGSQKANMGNAFTNATGHFDAIILLNNTNHNNNNNNPVYVDPNLCYLQVSLPVSNCDLFPPTGFLRAAILPFEVIDGVFGAIAKFLSGVFQHVE